MTDFRIFEDGVERPVESMSKDELPIAVALVVDRSASVQPFLDKIKGAVYKALSQLKQGDQACLFGFAARTERYQDLTTDLQRVADKMAQINVEGGTDIVSAVYEATTYLERTAPNRRRAVILISDNEVFFVNGVPPPYRLDETVKLLHKSETVLYSIKMEGAVAGGFFPTLPGLTLPLPSSMRREDNPVPSLATPTGGEIFEVQSSNTGAVERALATVIGRLKVRYTLGYVPSGEKDEAHTLEVRLVDRFGKPNAQYSILARSATYDVSAANKKR